LIGYLLLNQRSPMVTSKWTWRGKLARIAAAEASYEGEALSERLETVDTLVGLAGDDDPIVGFAAKEALVRLLSGKFVDPIGSHSRSIVRCVALVHTAEGRATLLTTRMAPYTLFEQAST
jgi:hypothetical protein